MARPTKKKVLEKKMQNKLSSAQKKPAVKAKAVSKKGGFDQNIHKTFKDYFAPLLDPACPIELCSLPIENSMQNSAIEKGIRSVCDILNISLAVPNAVVYNTSIEQGINFHSVIVKNSLLHSLSMTEVDMKNLILTQSFALCSVVGVRKKQRGNDESKEV